MTPSSAYLTAYNTLSCALWTYLLVHTLAYAPALYASGNLHELYHDLLFPVLAGTQTLALVEIAHAATGLVRASPVTTAIQVVGKNLVVWTVMVAFPGIVVSAGIWPFVGCVVFWGLSEVVRYGYFVVLLTTGDAPGWLKWLRYVSSSIALLLCRPVALGLGVWRGSFGKWILICYDRYSAFIVLYPPGLISEAWLVYLALTEAVDIGLMYRGYLLLGFLTYIPGKSRVDSIS